MYSSSFTTSLSAELLWFMLSTLLIRGKAGNTDKCYQPNGAAVTTTGGSLQIPLHACPASADGFATCCAEGDICSPDRLCYNPGGSNVWRNFCTDPTWKSLSCSPLCQGTTEWDDGPVQLTPCQDGMMCCGQNNTQCCSNHQGTYAFNGVSINATSHSASNKLSGGSIAGIVIGVIALIVLIALAILLAIKIRDDRRQRRLEGRDQYQQDVMERKAPPESTVRPINFHASVRNQQDAAVSTVPRYPSQAHELGDANSVKRFEAPGSDKYLREEK